jgi:hypothetical protein
LGRLRPCDVKTLLVSGTLDVATPAQVATHEVMPFLRRGRQVILPGMSHLDLFQERPNAFQTLAMGFFDRGQVDDSGFAESPPGLGTGLGLPTLVKRVVVGLILAAGAVGGLGWWLVRFVRRAISRNRYIRRKRGASLPNNS